MSAFALAALYVVADGVYFGMEGIDPWDADRDARLYAGPHPVIAHPPCASWCRWAGVREAQGFGKRGDDGGCFEHALRSVRTYGGVLEHPAHSAAFAAFGIAEPLGADWAMIADSSGLAWVISIDQADWGLKAHKPTWLYYVGDAAPLPLAGTFDSSGARPGPKDLHSGHRHLTPVALRDDLIRLVSSDPAVPPVPQPQEVRP